MARERYLLDNEESTIHANQIVPTTAAEKRANWWYHYKVKLIAGVLLGAALISLVWSILDNENPDYKITIATEYGFPNELIYDIEDHFEQYADDRNGDGKVLVDVQHCLFNTNPQTTADTTELQSAYVRFSADAGAGESMLFIFDDASYKFLLQDGISDGFFETAEGVEGEYDRWGDLKSLNKLTIDAYQAESVTSESVRKVLETLNFAVRSEKGDAFSKEEKVQYRQDSVALFERLKNDTPVETE